MIFIVKTNQKLVDLHGMNGCWFYNRTECFNIIHAGPLMKSFGHKSGLIVVNTTIRLHLNSINPLATRVEHNTVQNEKPNRSDSIQFNQFGFKS